MTCHSILLSHALSNATGPLPYRLTNDYLFRAVLQSNNSVLKGLICALLHLAPENVFSVTITNPIELCSQTYLCRSFDNLNRGQDYSEVKPVIHIGFLDFTLFPENPEFMPLICL